MKKLFVTLLAVLTCGAAYTLPVGNPSEASLLCDGLFWEGSCCMDPCDPCATWCDAVSFRFGYYGDFVFNRHLRVHHHHEGDGRHHDAIEHTEVFTNAGYLALNVWDRVDIFSTLGATRLRIDTNAKTFITGLPVAGERFHLETRSNFSWSIGARGTVWECGCTSLGIEGQYFQYKPHISRITIADADSIYFGHDDDRGSRLKFQEWQIGFGISHRINILVPYIAAKWSRARLNFEKHHDITGFPTVGDTLEFHDLRSRNGWGFAAGVSLVDCEKAAVTVEGRWGNERALYVNGQIRF